MRVTPKNFKPGHTAYRLTNRQTYERNPNIPDEDLAYERYIQPYEVTAVGRKFVTIKNGMRFMNSETYSEENWLTEHTQYSPEYKLFRTHQEAVDYIIKNITVTSIRTLAGRLQSDRTDKQLLKDIEELLKKAAAQERTEK